LVFSILILGASSGITMVAWKPSIAAAAATPCAWLPEEKATTARAWGCLSKYPGREQAAR
jgi:hypothetical protein